jgi:hypothetical protein
VAQYTKDAAAFKRAALTALKRATQDLENKDVLPNITYRGFLEIRMDGQEAPHNPGKLDTTRFQKDISFLKLSADETILISTDSDWARYL